MTESISNTTVSRLDAEKSKSMVVVGIMLIFYMEPKRR